MNKDKWRCRHRHTAYEHPLCWKHYIEQQINWTLGKYLVQMKVKA